MSAMGSFLRRVRAALGHRGLPQLLAGDVRVRRMGYRDLRAVVAIENASFRGPWRPNSYARAVADAHHSFFVAEVNSEIVGYAGMWVEGHQAHIAKVAVREEHRRRGIGTLLLRHLLDHARRLGLSQAYLEVRRGNLEAQDLYRRFGFRFERVQPNAYPDDGEDALIFVLRGLLDIKPAS
ncbi:MAG TPA: ribosomal protein S18-alanine N-acetyltransferase [Planctomycetota bacterium]|nr:ribosomal protein S18-alanine N-acetyltransferase [Planctomycetota bacterium]HRR81105.1 ribosomal protein S18-alanine N-acetyltransferase [Planctomycetota bacterium]HRT93481.1 ribosomal protein S18-alanine N-acetyltransferase [Planctomycetota bacterium]